MRSGWLRHTHRSHTLWHWTFWAGVLVVIYFALKALAPVLTPIVAAMGMAYLLDPLVERLAKRGMSRTAAVALIVLSFIILLLSAVAVLVPLVAKDMDRFGGQAPDLFARAAAWLQVRFDLDIPATWHDAVDKYGADLRVYAAESGGPLFRNILSAVGSVFGFLIHLFELLLVPVFAFYFLVDWPHIMAKLRGLVPPRYRATAGSIAREIDEKISHWVRGQLIVVGILAVLYAIALSIVGIHLAIVIGLLAGILTFVPYAGTVIGLGLSVAMALLDWHGPGQLIGIVGVFVVLHLLESYVLVPKLVGAKVGLGEAGALFGVLAGAQLLGFIGVMLAIPLAASVAVIVRRIIGYYESTEFFTDGVTGGFTDGHEAVLVGAALPATTTTTTTTTTPTEVAPAPEPAKEDVQS